MINFEKIFHDAPCNACKMKISKKRKVYCIGAYKIEEQLKLDLITLLEKDFIYMLFYCEKCFKAMAGADLIDDIVQEKNIV